MSYIYTMPVNTWPSAYPGYAPAVVGAPKRHSSSRPRVSRRNTIHDSPESTSSNASLPGNYRLHSLIAAPSSFSRSSNMTWDVRFAPSRSAHILSSPKLGVPSRNGSEYATNPPIPRMRITCDVFGQGWRVYVESPRGVTVDDVLNQLYAALRKAIRSGQWASMSESERGYVTRAWHKRVNSSEDPRLERNSGVRTVDLLQKHTVFIGLKPDPLNSGSWVLVLKRRD